MLDTFENIKKLRIEKGWTQEELAIRMGYTDRSSIAKIESGKVDLARSKILEFAKVFGVNASDLMGDDGIVNEADYHVNLPNEDKLFLERLHKVRQSTLDSINLLIEADLRNS